MSTDVKTDKAPPKSRNGVGSRLAAVGIVLAGVAVVVALGALLPKRGEDKPPPAAAPVNITVLPIEPIAEMAETFDLYGVVEPNRVVAVSAEVPGRVEHFGRRQDGGTIDEGARVKAGDVLAVLNKDLLQAEYDQAETRAEFDKQEWKRVHDASRTGAATPAELDKARSAMNMSGSQFTAAEIRLKRAEILSPVDGILDDLPVEAGEYVNVGQCVARIVDTEKVKVVLDVPERDVQDLKVGQAETILPHGRDGKETAGSISFISELADEQTRTSRVEITVDNRRRALRAGQIIRVRLSRGRLRDVVMVPLRAVIPEENGKSVYVEAGGKAQRREVKLGFFQDLDVQIVEGLEAGDRLIVEGFRFVGPDQPVRVVSIEEPSAIRTARGAAEPVENAP